MHPPKRSTAPGRRERARERGYTAVEVALSILVLGIGAAGVMTMQAASVQGNSDAHMIDTGNAIAREWVERLRRDSMTWTTPDTANQCGGSACNWSTNTFLVSQIGNSPGTWIWPAAPTTGSNSSTLSPWGYGRAFDILGRDVTLTGKAQPGVMFCVNIKGDWLWQDQLLRATVRVYWPRQMYAAPTAVFCSGAEVMTPQAVGGPTQVYHFIYATTALQRNSSL
jgi:type II secretory pathway pseudopilin PulG